ncbi:unnamed protein product [Cyprideis torosa]|uniref:Uncharacterized protein n=1 Tax=Cyprideis torosa TaxID=163714 RepID=A0A7R8WA33_9CRUS|nr:unnamed protein product [Cyprideis torosa]CAG0884933.1 unnamed protein product [Cyprideis torosa]
MRRNLFRDGEGEGDPLKRAFPFRASTCLLSRDEIPEAELLWLTQKNRISARRHASTSTEAYQHNWKKEIPRPQNIDCVLIVFQATMETFPVDDGFLWGHTYSSSAGILLALWWLQNAFRRYYQVHIVIAILCYVIGTITFYEMKHRNSVMASLGKCYFTALLGVWMFHAGDLLMHVDPFRANLLRTKQNLQLFYLSMSLILDALIVASVFVFLVAIVARSTKACAKKP